VTGASGGVGMATIEIAKALKWNVIAGVSTHGKVDAPKAVGADVVLVYGKTRADRQLFKSQVQDACRILRGRGDHSNRVGTTDGVDLVVDMVQGDLFEQALVSVVRPLGTIALVGFAAGQRPIRPGLLLVKEINVVGSLWGRFAVEHPEQHRRNVHHILQMLASGQIKPRVDTIVPLENFIDAFEIFETNRGRGNTVVSFMDDDGAASSAAAEVMRSRL
jgi:NADPH:quinone reductase-like Zn-dependent oxidoreductase